MPEKLRKIRFHHLGLVNNVAGLFHLLAANDAHALEHAAALRHLLDAQNARFTVVGCSKRSHASRQAAAAYQHVGFLGAQNLRRRDVAHLKGHRPLAHDAAFHVKHRYVTRFHGEHIGVDLLVEVAATTFVLHRHASGLRLAGAAGQTESARSRGSANQANARCAHKAATRHSAFCLLYHFPSLMF